ncbi:MAG: hypothetical protein M3N41_07275 [Acidobacteriota bacterium]|nr:hypothetical protein [Acidobacteriota bacterium]
MAASGLALAQDPQDDAPPPPQVSAQDQAGPQGAGRGPAPSGPQFQGQQPPPPNYGGWRRLGPVYASPGQPPQAGPPPGGFDPRYAPAPPPPQAVPAQLTIAPGTFFTVRVNQVLSSDRNQAGDAFSATLVKPIVVNGVIVADRGQVIQGRVSEAKKAGRVSGVSHLGLELTDMTLVDGSQVPVKTELVSRNGTTSQGRDAVGIGAATGIGAIIGAGAAGRHEVGEGAAIGAGAGAAAGIIGVLLTRGNPTIVRPEQVLTFRMDNPVVVNTDRAPQAFRYVGPNDYQQAGDQPRSTPSPGRYYGGYYGPAYYPYYGYGYPYFYGPSIGIEFGGRFGGRVRR